MLSIISPPNNTVYGSAENKVYRLSIAVIYFIYYELVLTLVDYTKYKQWWKNRNYELLYKISMNI